jgi:pimeloyl-ACP methyl ester carboxylesterase
VTLLSFTPEYYNANHSKLLGPQGGWKELNGRFEAHSRLVEACVNFESRSRLGQVKCPTLVIHAALDVVTSPRTTVPIEKAIPGAIGETWDDLAHVVAGKEQKIRFCNRLFDWLDSN